MSSHGLGVREVGWALGLREVESRRAREVGRCRDDLSVPPEASQPPMALRL